MSIYSNENISKIVKLSPHEFPHLVQNHENYGVYSILNLVSMQEDNWDAKEIIITWFCGRTIVLLQSCQPVTFKISIIELEKKTLVQS